MAAKAGRLTQDWTAAQATLPRDWRLMGVVRGPREVDPARALPSPAAGAPQNLARLVTQRKRRTTMTTNSFEPLEPGRAVFFAEVAPPEDGYIVIEDLGPDVVLHFAMAFYPARAGDPVPDAAAWGAFSTAKEAEQAARELFGDRLGELQPCPTDGSDCYEFARTQHALLVG